VVIRAFGFKADLGSFPTHPSFRLMRSGSSMWGVPCPRDLADAITRREVNQSCRNIVAAVGSCGE
jgi:hypothetical protein